MDFINYTHCPSCGSQQIRPVLKVRDYTVSHKIFEIWECDACTLRFTQAIPPEDQIGPYYQAEDYISHTNTNKGIINRLYHLVRSFTLRSKRRLIQKVSSRNTGHLLDIGAGTGIFASFMKNSGWRVIGLEPEAATRQRAKTINNIDLLGIDQLWELPAESFDVITMWHVLEHVHQLHEYLDRIHTLLKPGGVAIIAGPNYHSGDGDHYQEYWAAYDVPRHLYHFTATSMRTLFPKHQLKVKAILPMWFDSFYVALLSEQYKTGKTSLVKGTWRGLQSNLGTLRNRERCSSLTFVVTKS